MNQKPKKIEVLKERQELSAEKDWQKLVQSEINQFRKLLRKTGFQKKKDGLSIFDFTEPMKKNHLLRRTCSHIPCRKRLLFLAVTIPGQKRSNHYWQEISGLSKKSFRLMLV